MNAVSVVRTLGIIEGVSFVLLLFVAMPLKYAFDFPLAVRVVGMAHGVLLIAFVMALTYASSERGWPARRGLKLFGSSLVPFGFLWLARELQTESLGGDAPEP